MKKLFLSLLVIIATAFTVLFLVRDPIAKFAIEKQGSEAWGAPIKIGEINIDIINKTAHIKNLNLANPDDSKNTLAKADHLHIEINPESILDNKIEIVRLEIDGLSLLSNLTFKNDPPGSQSSAITLPNFNLPDTNTLIDSKKSALKTDINRIKAEVNGIENKWKTKLDNLPDQSNLDQYKASINQLKDKGDLFEKLAAAKDLEKIYREIRQDLNQLKSLQSDFRQDREQLKIQINSAKELPQKYSKELVQSFGLDTSQLSNLASSAFAGSLKNTLKNLLSSIDIPRPDESQSSGPAYDVIIHQAVIKGPIFEQIPGLALTTNLSDLTYPFEKATKAVSVDLDGGIDGSGGLQLISTIDHRDGIDDNFEIKASGLQLQDIRLAEHPDISIGLSKALLNMTGTLSLKDEKISGELVQSFSDSNFITELSPGASKAASVIAEVLAVATEFGLTMSFGGTLSDPKLSFKTSKLDTLISEAVMNQVGREIQRLQSDASHTLSQQLAPEIQLMLSQIEGLNSIGLELEDQKKTWGSLGK